MTERIEEDGSSGMLYSIRLLIRHPELAVQTITAYLGTNPTYSWDASDRGRSDTMWSLETWTEGKRNFFDELGDVLGWLEGKQALIKEVRAGGGKVIVIAQLSGQSNVGDELSPEAMARASALGVSIGVEVFPNLRHPRKGAGSNIDVG